MQFLRTDPLPELLAKGFAVIDVLTSSGRGIGARGFDVTALTRGLSVGPLVVRSAIGAEGAADLGGSCGGVKATVGLGLNWMDDMDVCIMSLQLESIESIEMFDIQAGDLLRFLTSPLFGLFPLSAGLAGRIRGWDSDRPIRDVCGL